MATISVFAAKHADKAHILEFFLKNLLNPGERPIAFFDGFFYEAKNERVGGLSFQDYLIFSDKSVYFWARGPQKDYLDRFSLGAVSFTSKEKENDISTLDIIVNRKGKSPIFLVFDFVPSDEAEKIVMLHVLFETAIEKEMGRNYWDEIPKETADTVFDIGRATYPPVEIEFIDYQQPQSIDPSFAGTSPAYTRPSLFGSMGSGQGADQSIGYGQNLLEQFKMAREINGYLTANHPTQEGAMPQGARYQPPFPNPFQQQAPLPGVFPFENPFGNFGRENPQNNRPQQFNPPVGPAGPVSQDGFPEVDIVTLKRMGALVKDIIHSIPEEYREQAKHTLRMIPENLEKLPSNTVQVIDALNELLENVSHNKQTQDFLIRSIGTAVKNDGLIGVAAKLMKTLLPPPIYKQKSQQRRETPKTAWDERQQQPYYERAKSGNPQPPGKQHEPPPQVQKEPKPPETAESRNIWDMPPSESDAGNDGFLSRRKKIKIKPES